jgi:hypothetical protein
MTLTEFLLARIAEDEEIARACPHQVWGYRKGGNGGRAVLQVHGPKRVLGESQSEQRHMSRWHPARALRECDAKRALIRQDRNGWREAERVLAAVYAGHPDYDEAWRPHAG